MAGFATQYTLAIVIQEISRGRAISDAKQRLQGLGTTADKAGNQTLTAMEKLKRGIRGVASTIGRVLTPALALGGLAAANFAKDAALEYAKYEQTLREVFTLAPDLNEAAQEQIRGQIMTTGVEYGRLTEETIPALYQAISLGIPPDNAPAAVELAAKAATAGVAGLESTMVTGLTIMNAHKLGVEDLAHIYDVLQTMIRFGFIRMDEMNRVMGPLNKTAADSGTSLESVAAAMITLTRQGLDAAGAAELLNFLLLQLATDGTAAFKAFQEASGQGYRQFIAGGGTLVEALTLMQEHAIATGQSLTTMIAGDSKFYRDQQAARATMGLTGRQLENLIEQSENVANAAGAVGTAFEEVSGGVQFEINQAKAAFEEFKLSVGEGIALGAGGDAARGGVEFARAASGSRARQIQDMVETRLAAQETQEDMLEDLNKFAEAYRFAWLFKGGTDVIQEGIKTTTQRLIEQSDSLEDAQQILIDYGVAVALGGDIQNTVIEVTGQRVDVLWEEAQAAMAAAEAEENRAAALLDAADADRRHQQEKPTGPITDPRIPRSIADPFRIAGIDDAAMSQERLNQLTESYMHSLDNIAGQMPVFERMRMFSDEAASFVDSVTEITSTLFDNYEDLAQSEQDWFSMFLEHTDQVTTIGGELADSNLIAQAFGLSEDEADKAREAIGGALRDIQSAYEELGQSIVETALLEKFGGTSAEIEKQLVGMKLAMGAIEQEEADFLVRQIEQADQLDRVLNTMLEDYLKLGGISAEETEALAKAMEIVGDEVGLTDEAVILLAESTATSAGAMSTALEQGPEAATDRLAEKLGALEDEDWEPEVTLEEQQAADKLKQLEQQLILVTTTDWVIPVRFRQVGNIPTPQGVGGGPRTGIGHHAGGSFTIPNRPEFQNDGYLALLNARESVSVRTPSQVRQDKLAEQAKGMYIDNSQTTIINENEQTAAVALAWKERQRERRINKTMGG